MMRQITCPNCHSQYMVDDVNRVIYCQNCGNMLTIHNAQLDKGKNRGRIIFALVCVLFFLGLISNGQSGGNNRKNNESETRSTNQRNGVAETTSSAQASRTVTSTQMNYASETKNKIDSASGVTPELKEFLDEYEAIMDQYVLMMQKSDSTYKDDSGKEMMTDYFTLLYRLASFEEKAAQLDQEKMSDADAKYYLEVMYRIEMKLLGAAIKN